MSEQTMTTCWFCQDSGQLHKNCDSCNAILDVEQLEQIEGESVTPSLNLVELRGSVTYTFHSVDHNSGRVFVEYQLDDYREPSGCIVQTVSYSDSKISLKNGSFVTDDAKVPLSTHATPGDMVFAEVSSDQCVQVAVLPSKGATSVVGKIVSSSPFKWQKQPPHGAPVIEATVYGGNDYLLKEDAFSNGSLIIARNYIKRERVRLASENVGRANVLGVLQFRRI